MSADLVWVIASVHLPGNPPLRPGDIVQVDPRIPKISRYMQARWLEEIGEDGFVVTGGGYPSAGEQSELHGSDSPSPV